MPEPITYTFEVKVLMLLENGTWIAQGLNYDITGHGDSTTAALDNLGKTLIGQALVDLSYGEQPLANIPEAPSFYWKRFNEAEWGRGEQKRFELSEEMPPAFMVHAFAADTRMSV